MADLNQLLAQILGLREEERPNLNPHAGAPGLFGRRVVPGRPALGYGDVAPMPPQWAERGPQTISAPQQQMNPFPFPVGGPEPQQVPVAPMPQAARVGISDQNSPGAFGNFADYANTTMGLRTPQAPVQAPEPWTQPVGTETWAAGRPSTGRGLEPPSAPARYEPAPFSMEDEAWQEARRRIHTEIQGERQRDRMNLPRPGRPLIAQAWSAPVRRNRRDVP